MLVEYQPCNLCSSPLHVESMGEDIVEPRVMREMDRSKISPGIAEAMLSLLMYHEGLTYPFPLIQPDLCAGDRV